MREGGGEVSEKKGVVGRTLNHFSAESLWEMAMKKKNRDMVGKVKSE